MYSPVGLEKVKMVALTWGGTLLIFQLPSALKEKTSLIVILLFYRPAEEPAERIWPRHSLQH